MPAVYGDVRKLISDPNANIDHYAAVIKTDAMLTNDIIRIANSTLFGYFRTAQNIEQAISLIGVIQLHDLLLGSMAIRCFSGIPQHVVNQPVFWRNSVCCAIASRLLAKKCALLAGERLFVTGLLHDIGHLVFYILSPDRAQEIYLKAAQTSKPIFRLQREAFGFDYGEVGSELLRLWHLPSSYHETIKHHTEPTQAMEFKQESAIINLARNIALSDYSDQGDMIDAEGGDRSTWEIANITEETIKEVKQEVVQHISEAMDILMPNSFLVADRETP